MEHHKHEPYKIFFETLGNKVRWEIVHLLQNGEENATEIARKLKYEQSLISHHLKRLEICGLVAVEQKGRKRVYRLNQETILPLLQLMDKHINTFCKQCASKLQKI